MLRKIAISVLAGAALLSALVRPTAPSLAATETQSLCDTDSDFLPDAVEWVTLTSAGNPDTDGDLISDFVEVVQRARPRRVSEPLPPDQEMRIVVSGPGPGSASTQTWLHVLVRVMGPMSSLTAFNAWLELPAFPGIRFGFDLMSFGPVSVQQRNAGAEGLWLVVSVPLADQALLHQLAPFSLHAASTIAGRPVSSAVTLFDMQGQLSTLVPFDATGYAVQAIAAPGAGGGNLSNRVCLLDLSEVGSGPGGTVYEVMAARCEDCNEVECSPTCPESVGWLITIPGGLTTIDGH